MRKRKAAETKRRLPTRARAHETIAVIFEAVARILQADGLAGLNTNRIAEVAGIGIGTIYGYFENKETILLAMARRELDKARDHVSAALMDQGSGEPDPARRAIRALIKSYGTRGKVRRILMETLFAHGGSEEMARPVYEIAEVLRVHGSRLLPPNSPSPSTISLYILTRAVDCVVRTATYDGVKFLGSREFEDELVRLIYGYLGPRAGGPGSR